MLLLRINMIINTIHKPEVIHKLTCIIKIIHQVLENVVIIYNLKENLVDKDDPFQVIIA